MSVQRHEGNPETLGLLFGSDGSGHGHDVFQLAGLELLTETFHGEVGRGSSSQTDNLSNDEQNEEIDVR